jgi:uncharacterized membrane protein YidH (DUF202 family)
VTAVVNADESAEERTRLAVERTMLAWWRTGLAALAVALAVGRLLPEISADITTRWPYVTLGLGFAAYAAGLFAYGTFRAVRGRRPAAPVAVVAAAGTLLALATMALIAGG